MCPPEFIAQVFDVIRETPQHTYQVLTKRAQRLSRIADELDWPSNLWMGVSVETRRYAFRIKHLRKAPAAVRFVSAEPLLGPLGDLDLDGIHWVIAGGESGANARPMQLDWVTELRDTCTSAGVAFFFKQWGGRTPKAGGRELEGEYWDELAAQGGELAQMAVPPGGCSGRVILHTAAKHMLLTPLHGRVVSHHGRARSVTWVSHFLTASRAQASTRTQPGEFTGDCH